MNNYFQLGAPLQFATQQVLDHPRLPMSPPTKQGLFLLDEFRKQDRNQMSNLDRFLEAAIPQIDAKTHSVADLVAAFTRTSVHGLHVEVQDDQDLASRRMLVFMPTLSSLSFIASGQRAFVEFHEILPPFLR